MWPFGPKLKPVGTIHRSGRNPILNQVEESPVTIPADGATQSEKSSNQDPGNRSPNTPLTTHTPSATPVAIPPADVELSLHNGVENGLGRGRGLSERSEEVFAQTKSISDLRLTSQKVNDLTRTIRENHQQTLRSVAQVSVAQVSQDFDAVIKNMEEKHQRAIQAKEKNLQDLEAVIKSMEQKHQRAVEAREQELQQLKAELEQSKVESAMAIVSKDLSLSTANDEITSLRSQLALQNQDQGDNNRVLTRLRAEVKALKERLASSQRPAKVAPEFIHINLFDAAPELLPEHIFFDVEAKKKEIEKRPSRKQTFGRRLTHIRRERGQYPHREIYRHSAKPCEIYRDATICLTEEPTGTIPAKRRELQDLGPGEVIDEKVRGSKGEEKGPMSLEEMMGVPRNAIPCLVEGQLAYREGTRVCLLPLHFLGSLLIKARAGRKRSTSPSEGNVQGGAQRCWTAEVISFHWPCTFDKLHYNARRSHLVVCGLLWYPLQLLALHLDGALASTSIMLKYHDRHYPARLCIVSTTTSEYNLSTCHKSHYGFRILPEFSPAFG